MLEKIRWFARYYERFPHVVVLLLILTPSTADRGQHPAAGRLHHRLPQVGAVPAALAGDARRRGGGAAWDWRRRQLRVAFMALGCVSALLYMTFQSTRAWMNVRLEWLFRQAAFDRITTKGPDFFNRFRTGDLVTRMTDDVSEKLSWFACSGSGGSMRRCCRWRSRCHDGSAWIPAHALDGRAAALLIVIFFPQLLGARPGGTTRCRSASRA